MVKTTTFLPALAKAVNLSKDIPSEVSHGESVEQEQKNVEPSPVQEQETVEQSHGESDTIVEEPQILPVTNDTTTKLLNASNNNELVFNNESDTLNIENGYVVDEDGESIEFGNDDVGDLGMLDF